MRDDTHASGTAAMVAAFRARATAGDPTLCRDPWAAALAGDAGYAAADAFARGFPAMEQWIALRTRYLDDWVQRLTASPHSFGQVVLLGAGFDTRAARLDTGGARFFEVDHPGTQAAKVARLAALDGYPKDAATHVPCDFEAGDDVFERLCAAGFVADAPTVIIWEGVTLYLTDAAVRATARTIAERFDPRATLLFDFVGKRMAQRRGVGAGHERNLDYVGALGEPIRWGTNDILPLLYEAGFRHVRTISFDEIALSLTGSYAREREFRFQHIALASVQAPLWPW